MDAAYDTVVTGLDTLQEGVTLQWEKLCEIQTQQLAKEEVATVMRHLEEVVDVLHALQKPVVVPTRQWPWWVHPSCYTLTLLVGLGLGLEVMLWRSGQMIIAPRVPQVAPQVQKGKK